MVPRIVIPKVRPWPSCTTASSASGGSYAVTTQRTTALAPPIAMSEDGCSEKRGDSANTTISAITPNVQRPAIVSPPRPWACQLMAENV
ncbi:hypothetical protein ACVWZ6_006909 [Bradyrhizobium sp. GM6.1]